MKRRNWALHRAQYKADCDSVRESIMCVIISGWTFIEITVSPKGMQQITRWFGGKSPWCGIPWRLRKTRIRHNGEYYDFAVRGIPA